MTHFKQYAIYLLAMMSAGAHAASRALISVDDANDSPCFNSAVKLDGFEAVYSCTVTDMKMCVTIPKSNDPKQREFQISHKDEYPGNVSQCGGKCVFTFHFPIKKSTDVLAGSYRDKANWRRESNDWTAIEAAIIGESVSDRIHVPGVSQAAGVMVASAYYPFMKLKMGVSNLVNGAKDSVTPSEKFTFDAKARTLTVKNYYYTNPNKGSESKGDCVDLKTRAPEAQDETPDNSRSH